MSEFEERQVSWQQRFGFAETERVQSWFYCKSVHGSREIMFLCLKSSDCISRRELGRSSTSVQRKETGLDCWRREHMLNGD